MTIDCNKAAEFNLFKGKAMKSGNNSKNVSHIPRYSDPVDCGLITCSRLIISLSLLSSLSNNVTLTM